MFGATPPAAAFAGTQFVAAAVVAGLCAVAGLVTKLRGKPHLDQGRGGLIMGWDRRLSTSKTIAAAWTAVLAYMVVTLVLVATSQSDDFLKVTLNNAQDLYLVFLGGPYAAAILAKVGTVASIQKGNVKADGDGHLKPADLISNDTGSTDLYDFQYTLFNLVGIFAVLVAFIPHPAAGLPQIPDFLAILTGGSALTYTANKAATTTTTSTTPAITRVDPPQAAAGAQVTIYGTNLNLPSAASDLTVVKVGDRTALADQAFPDRVLFTVPAGAAVPAPVDVKVVTNFAAVAALPGALTLV